MTTDPLTIISEQKRFYQELCTSGHGDDDAVKNFLTVLDTPKLTEEQNYMCEGKILHKECELMLETFQNNKVPGNDRIPVEFYKKFWTLLSEPFVPMKKNVPMNVLKYGNVQFPKASSDNPYRKKKERSHAP